MRNKHSVLIAAAIAGLAGACREPMMVDDVARDTRTDARRDATDVSETGTDVVSDTGLDVVDAVDAQPDVPTDVPCSPDLQTDPHHCGSCGNDCTLLPGVASTIACNAGVCDLANGCATGRAHCSSTPTDGCETDISTPTNCGACGTTCSEPTPMCTLSSGGVRSCASGCSGATPTRCNMMCVNTATNAAHCGACDNACPAPANGSATCAASTCGFQCNAGFAERNGACDPAYTIGGTVTGLSGASLTLQNNGGDDLTVSADGMFTFHTGLFEGAGYAVTISQSPPGRVCTIAMGSGTVGTSNVTDVTVTCRAANVVLNEIYARPATLAYGDTNGDSVRDSSADEFIEVRNMESVPVDISGWVIRAGNSNPTVRHTFPANSIVPANGYAVVFGGGTPTGGFGGALVQVAASSLSLSDAPTTAASITLETATTGGMVVDTFGYDSTTFGSSCTTGCSSRTRSPEGTGGFVAHTTVSGTGILWSPGVAATQAVPKVERGFSIPAASAANVSITTSVLVQFNMFMTTAEFTNANLRLFASTCAAMTNEITSFTSIGAGSDATSARLVPASPLAYATTYCVNISGGLHSAQGTMLDAATTWEFTTRMASSSPSATVVISEYGGASFSGNDEFVELYNPTAADVDISGWSIQRRTAAGTSSCWATLPANVILPPGRHYLIGGASYNAASYGGVTADFMGTGTSITGTIESVLLVQAPGSCTSTTSVADSVSVGAVTESIAALQLPPTSGPIPAGGSVERKACFNSTADAAPATGMYIGGGHELQGNSERVGASNADWIARTMAQPQNLASPVETRTCP